jgi:hypothetical protein
MSRVGRQFPPLAVAAMLCFAPGSFAQTPKSSFLNSWQPLLGRWTAEGGGAPGRSVGEFSFAAELDGQVVVRRNRSESAASEGSPAHVHEDLTIIYPGAAGERAQAVYFDNEGHQIHYTAEWSGDGKELTMVSEPAAGAPRFRFTYKLLAPTELRVSFDIAPPGKPDAFTPYLAGNAHKAQGSACSSSPTSPILPGMSSGRPMGRGKGRSA